MGGLVMCGRCRQRAHLERHGRSRRRPSRGAAPRPPSPWAGRSQLFQLVVARGWTPEGRAGTPAEWDAAMERAYGPGVGPDEIAKACKGAVKFLPPDQVLEPLRARWLRPGGQA